MQRLVSPADKRGLSIPEKYFLLKLLLVIIVPELSFIIQTLVSSEDKHSVQNPERVRG